METSIASVETSVQPPNALMARQEPAQNASTYYYEPLGQFARQKEIAYLKELVYEKDTQIEQLTKENKFLYAELERLRAQSEEQFKRSDALIDQMQAATEESNKRAQAIIMQLSRQIENQAEQIEILQALQGLGGTVRHLKSKLPSLRIGSIRRALQSHFATNR
jgi:predicted RNase H-like nuclease (RuvC/YqgF family)